MACIPTDTERQVAVCNSCFWDGKNVPLKRPGGDPCHECGSWAVRTIDVPALVACAAPGCRWCDGAGGEGDGLLQDRRAGAAGDDADLVPATPQPERLMKLVNEQANDEGLWFIPVYATEAILQRALRDLHAAIEGKTP